MINEEEFTRGSAFRRLEVGGEGVGEREAGFTSQMMQVISAQNILIMKLLHRQNQLYRQLAQQLPSSDSGSGNDKSRHPPSQDPLAEQQSSSSPLPLPRSPLPQRSPAVVVFPRPSRVVQERPAVWGEEEDGGEEEGVSNFREERERPRQPETKNMIKNFSKAIFGFISKHADCRARALAAVGVEEEDFMAFIGRSRGRVLSIAELRGLWTREDNYGRVFRILSGEYLRRHCLERTFNSRVQNYAVHLKYRQRLLLGLRRPQEFTALKMD